MHATIREPALTRSAPQSSWLGGRTSKGLSESTKCCQSRSTTGSFSSAANRWRGSRNTRQLASSGSSTAGAPNACWRMDPCCGPASLSGADRTSRGSTSARSRAPNRSTRTSSGSLYSAENRRRRGRSTNSGPATPRGPGRPSAIPLRSPTAPSSEPLTAPFICLSDIPNTTPISPPCSVETGSTHPSGECGFGCAAGMGGLRASRRRRRAAVSVDGNW